MLRLTYAALYFTLLPFLLLKYLLRSSKNREYRYNLKERLCINLPKFVTQARPIHFHLVSVGEVNAAQTLILKLTAHFPNNDFLITVTTPTGRNRAISLFSQIPNITIRYLPFDIPVLMARFLKVIAPQISIMMETELWPYFLLFAKRMNVPVVLINARLSKKSLKGYLRMPETTKDMIAALDLVLAQYKPDKKRFIRLGCHEDKIKKIGNIKFDIALPKAQLQSAAVIKSTINRPTWIAASTHEGEERLILEAHRKLLESDPNILLILVPRHKERFKEVAAMSVSQFKIQHRTTLTLPNTVGHSVNINSLSVPIHSETEVLIGDTIGEMFWYLALSDICFVGGSLVKTGGHNPIEPAALGIPVLTGPYTYNFKTVFKQCLNKKFCIRVNSAHELYNELQILFKKPKVRAKMATQANKFVTSNQGVTDIMINELLPLIKEEPCHESRFNNYKTANTD